MTGRATAGQESSSSRYGCPTPRKAGSGEGSRPDISPYEKECLNLKMFLMTQTDPDAPSLYDHLSDMLATILDTKPDVVMETFEDKSRDSKVGRMSAAPTLLRDHAPPSLTCTMAQAQWDLIKQSQASAAQYSQSIRKTDTSVNQFKGIPDIMRQAAYFEMAGFGLPREEYIRVTLSLNVLADRWRHSLQSIRFWGKILGTVKNYYVAEAEFVQGDYTSDMVDVDGDVIIDVYDVTGTAGVDSDIMRDTTLEDMTTAVDDDYYSNSGKPEDSSLFDDVILTEDLKPTYKPPPKIPSELAGTGLNRMVYFVTSEPGLPWIRLPHVTPAQIQVARKIRKLLTGDLNAPIVTNPAFPGKERNYLRTQIARISACTHVSPLGYFRFDDEGEEEEEGMEDTGVVDHGMFSADPDYEGQTIKSLADPGLQGWVHHASFILPQGRTTWWNPMETKVDFDNNEAEYEDEEEEDREEQTDEHPQELGPPLLTPLAEDEFVGDSPPWVASATSKFVPEFAIAVIRSNVWIGAVAFGADKGKYFENLYIGWGQKNLADDFDPALPETPMMEFPSGPEISEADDPTPEQEAAMQAAIVEKQLEAEIEEQIVNDDDDGADIEDVEEEDDRFDEHGE